MLAAAIAALAACGARTELHTSAMDVPAVAEVGTDTGAVDVRPGQPCGCPGTAGFRYCVLPLMCCPGLRRCEDPAHFSCTGQTLPPCP